MPNVPRPRSLVPGRRARPIAADGSGGRAPSDETAVIDCAVYSDGRRQPGETTWAEAIDSVATAREGFVWLGLHEPTIAQIAGIAERFGLHPLAVEDAVHGRQRPKLDRYDDQLFAVVKTLFYDDTLPSGAAEVVETGEVLVFLGDAFVITVRHGEHGSLRGVRKRLDADPALLRLGPPAVLHAILDDAVDAYITVTNALQDDIDETETAVFETGRRIRDVTATYVLKREVLELRRAATPLQPVLATLARTELRLVHAQVRDYFRDVEDHVNGIVERVNAFDELLTSLVEANLARVSVVQNEDMRKISAWVAIAAVPTMLAGIYGMNFDHMPELHWIYGYPLVIAVMLAVCTTLYIAFKRNGWL